MSSSRSFPLQPRSPGILLLFRGSDSLAKWATTRSWAPSGGCSQWIISYICTLTRNSFHTGTVFRVSLRAFFHRMIFLSEKCPPLNMPSHLHCVFAKDKKIYEFCFIIIGFFLSVDLYSVSVLMSELQRPCDVNIKVSYLEHIKRDRFSKCLVYGFPASTLFRSFAGRLSFWATNRSIYFCTCCSKGINFNFL